MNIKVYDNDIHYPVVKGWWNSHGIPAMPAHILRATGYVSHDGDRDIAAAWLYMDYHCGVSWLNLFISNPEASPREIHQAHQDIVETFTNYAEKEGFVIMMAFYDRPSLVKVAKRSGFGTNHESVHEMYKMLNPSNREAVA